jgi:hypothetical protein
MWTLLERSWEANVWRAGAYLFGRDVDQHVPPLHSRMSTKRKPAPAPVVAMPAVAPTAQAGA